MRGALRRHDALLVAFARGGLWGVSGVLWMTGQGFVRCVSMKPGDRILPVQSIV